VGRENNLLLGRGYAINNEHALWFAVVKLTFEHECFVLKFMF